jgi:hypothetical protein
MSVARLCRRPCTIRYHAPGATGDVTDGPADEWTEVQTVCALQQRIGGRREDGTLGDLSQTLWQLYLLASVVPPKAADEVVVEGVTYQLQGDAFVAFNERRARASHIEATAVVAA